MAGGTFPTSVPSYPTISASETLGTMGAGRGHRQTHIDEETDIAALSTKLGTGAGGPPGTPGLLRRTATGASGWGLGQAADLATGVVGLNRIAQQIVAGSPAATITFNAIPSTYTDLICTVQARSSLAAVIDTLWMHVGTGGSVDTGANYDYAGVFSDGAATEDGEGAVATTALTVGYITASTGPAGEAGFADIKIGAYALTTWNKRCVSNSSYRRGTTTTTVFSEQFGGDWRNTAAIDTINFVCGANFAIGSVFTLWGVY